MTNRVRKRPQATVDLTQYAEYISRDSLDSALRFLDAAEQTFPFIAKMPEMGALCKFQSVEAKPVRFWPVRGFEKYLIFYLPLPDGIEIVRVLHGAMDLDSILIE